MLSAAQQIDLMTCQWVSTCSMENTALYRLSLMSSTHRSVIISILVCLHWQAVNAEGREHIFSFSFFFSLSILARVYVWVLSKWEYECSGVLTTIYFEFKNVIEFLEDWKNYAVYQVLRWPLPGSWTAS